MEAGTYLYKCPNFAANLHKMRLNKKWCDVTVRVNGTEIRAHKVILAANLKYFETMLSNESFQEGKDGIITMESVEPADLEAFIRYAYTGEILLTENNALNLLEVANYLSEDEIKAACILFLNKRLKVEEACRAYKFADAIECISLKTAAKALIKSNFENCSESADYLTLKYENLIDILSDGKAQPVNSQRLFFVGIISWIMHNKKKRKIHVNDLLSSIDITTLTADDLIGCLCGSEKYRNDGNIMRDIMFIYHTSKITQSKKPEKALTTSANDTDVCHPANEIKQIKEQKQVLLILGYSKYKLLFQYYNFTEKKWTAVQSAFSGPIYSNCAVLNNKLYYVSCDSKVYNLQMFDPSTKQIKTIHSSSSILADSAVCACSRFIYFCGGIKEHENHRVTSDQVLKYDMRRNSLETLPSIENCREYAAAIFYQDHVHVLGGRLDDFSALNSVEKYDPNSKKWTAFSSMCRKRYHHAIVCMDNTLFACGGLKYDSVEFYDPEKNRWQLLAKMNKWRKDLLLVAHAGKLFAIGGDEENTVEVYDPKVNQWHIDRDMSSGLEIMKPKGGLISANCIQW